jgi:hypothetical protein
MSVSIAQGVSTLAFRAAQMILKLPNPDKPELNIDD